MTIADSTIRRNYTGNEYGAGIHNAGGAMIVTNSTIADNEAGGDGATGGGLANSAGTVQVTNSTITGNQATHGAGGGGLFNGAEGGTITLQNTVLARNQLISGGTGPECLGPVTSQGHNLIGDPTGCTITLQPTDRIGDPGLDAFVDHGTPGAWALSALGDQSSD